jgi:hypothetical protein
MDETLRIVRHLYGEEPDADDFERRVRETPDLARELDSLREVKALLDEKPPQRPDASVVNAVVAEAARAASNSPVSNSPASSPAPAARTDRTSRDRTAGDRSASQRSGLSRRLQQVGLAAALILVAALGLWQFQTPPTDADSSARISAEIEQQLPPAARDLPDWDEGDDVVRLHRRLEVVNARSASPSSWSSQPAMIPAQSQRP